MQNLQLWFKDQNRKPLVIRGSRQVGKTWLVRSLATQLKLDLFELNFERNPKIKALFSDNDPEQTILQLESFFNRSINSKKALLFLDEIQAAPELLAKLRWFAEEKPELAVIATGSLLDFTLADHEFSMPVGRISYMYIEPMSFEEFLLALNQNKLCEYLSNFTLQDKIPEIIHDRLLQFLREYILVGGMPSAVEIWMQKKSFFAVSEIHNGILQTFRDDFAKYAKKIAFDRLDDIFRSIPNLLGKKFKYSLVNKEVRSEVLKKALNLLCKARVCHKVFSCSGNGVPLAADIKEDIFKVIFLDVGLVSSALGLSITTENIFTRFKLINEGSITEQLVGQLLRTVSPYYIDPKLYYWVREKSGSAAEIDYLMQYNTKVIPIEVKAGTTGTLRSLHGFMQKTKLQTAIRLNADFPSVTEVKLKDFANRPIEYTLFSLPFYLTEQINRLVATGGLEPPTSAL
ncbi:MAG: ATP-binding protein [Gammaproteobacteria bacterium]|nr:ATP-binding protein [Gammaproteobacteria bacterium]